MRLKRDDLSIPAFIRKSHDFDKVCPPPPNPEATEDSPADDSEPESLLCRMTIKYDLDRVTCEGLNVPLDFSKCPGGNAILALQNILLGEQGEVTLYVRSEAKKPLRISVEDLFARQKVDRAQPFYHRFYAERFHDADVLPFITFGQVSRVPWSSHYLFEVVLIATQMPPPSPQPVTRYFSIMPVSDVNKAWYGRY